MNQVKIGGIFTINRRIIMEIVNKMVAKVKSDRKVQIVVAVVAIIIIYNLIN